MGSGTSVNHRVSLPINNWAFGGCLCLEDLSRVAPKLFRPYKYCSTVYSIQYTCEKWLNNSYFGNWGGTTWCCRQTWCCRKTSWGGLWDRELPTILPLSKVFGPSTCPWEDLGAMDWTAARLNLSTWTTVMPRFRIWGRVFWFLKQFPNVNVTIMWWYMESMVSTLIHRGWLTTITSKKTFAS